MATTVWKGHLTFGLVSIPVRLYRAARSEKVSFHRLYRKDASRTVQGAYRKVEPDYTPAEAEETPIEQTHAEAEPQPELKSKRVESVADQPVSTAIFNGPVAKFQPIPRSELVRGYEYEKNRYVTIEDEDIKNITPRTAKEMEIQEFVKLDEIDPVYFETSYYVAPDEGGEKPYALLFEGLRKTGYVAMAQAAMHSREHIVILRTGKKGLLAHTMYYVNEIREVQEFATDTKLVTEKEMKLAVMLIESLKADFEPAKYKDTYREKVEAMIAAKVQGKEVVEAPVAKAAPVIDIMEALQKSLKQVRKPMGTEQPAETHRKAKIKDQRRAGGR